MDFVGGSNSAKKAKFASSRVYDSAETPRISLYLLPPMGDISIEEFEGYALDRLRVLQKVDLFKAKGKKGEDLDQLVYEEAQKYMPLLYKDGQNRVVDESAARRDIISHHVLRLAFSSRKHDERRRWFLNAECSLFRARCAKESHKALASFVKELGFDPMDKDEFETNKEKLKYLANMRKEVVPTTGDDAHTYFYKVPIETVPNLIARRQVLMRAGYAFIMRNDLISIAQGYFRAALQKKMIETERFWDAKKDEEGDRLLPVVDHLRNINMVSQPTSSTKVLGEVKPEQLDALSNDSFPLCMSSLHEALRRDHHLKHAGRLQYGLYLKGIGLKLDDALRFWKSEFIQKMPSDKFDKQYAYNVRFNYGQEGKRVDYTPLSCMRIIQGTPPGTGEHHGCPFRHFDAQNLESMLRSRRVNEVDIRGIVDTAKSGNFQIACQKYFASVHRISEVEAEPVIHPNEYFVNSIKRRQMQAGQN
mmetsp:Transcript_10347/g.27110  ORF Transcript_10347/g.27110 Transcript_10347/m.27110 type:complete len:476 (-) Transcript_10347:43-1470(-)